MNFGLWYDFRNPAQWQQPFDEFYAGTLAQIRDAEGLGFNSVWLTEHHFCDDGYTPSPLVLAAAIGAQLKGFSTGLRPEFLGTPGVVEAKMPAPSLF